TPADPPVRRGASRARRRPHEGWLPPVRGWPARRGPPSREARRLTMATHLPVFATGPGTKNRRRPPVRPCSTADRGSRSRQSLIPQGLSRRCPPVSHLRLKPISLPLRRPHRLGDAGWLGSLVEFALGSIPDGRSWHFATMKATTCWVSPS